MTGSFDTRMAYDARATPTVPIDRPTDPGHSPSVQPPTGRTTATPATRVLGALTLVGIAWLLAFGLGFSPADVNQGDAVRILYLHAPAAWVAYLAFIVTALASAIYLFTKKHSLGWDHLAGASAEIGVLFMGITLVVGMLWGRLTWGVFWRWDPRLTTTAFLFVTYIGYLAVRRLGGTPEQRAKRSAVLALLAVIEIPLVHFSVMLWRSLHQEASVFRPNGDVELDGLMLFTLLVGIVTFTLLYAWLVIHRQRTLAAEDALDDVGLELALTQRRQENLTSRTQHPTAEPDESSKPVTASAPDRSTDDTQSRRRERQRAAGRERSEPADTASGQPDASEASRQKSEPADTASEQPDASAPSQKNSEPES